MNNIPICKRCNKPIEDDAGGPGYRYYTVHIKPETCCRNLRDDLAAAIARAEAAEAALVATKKHPFIINEENFDRDRLAHLYATLRLTGFMP